MEASRLGGCAAACAAAALAVTGSIGAQQVTRGDIEPAWSPDGRLIAFSSTRAGSEDIWVMRADGTGLRRLTRDSYDDGAPDWQPMKS